jgi:hypothetical protein
VIGEPWLDTKKLAAHYSCCVREIDYAVKDGIPHAVLFGRKKFQVSAVEPWLRENGRFGDEG